MRSRVECLAFGGVERGPVPADAAEAIGAEGHVADVQAVGTTVSAEDEFACRSNEQDQAQGAAAEVGDSACAGG